MCVIAPKVVSIAIDDLTYIVIVLLNPIRLRNARPIELVEVMLENFTANVTIRTAVLELERLSTHLSYCWT